MKTGLKHSAAKIPPNRHGSHTGKSAPAMLITGVHPEMNNKETERIKWTSRKFVASVFDLRWGLLAKMQERIG